ncbi:hypothetical protein LTR84_011142 [Exophiala bonariae]|uniref:Uncharacterized protein n=1 Tax=Exophiala bonariae TaxID=1690606 RepID=A0AAV9NM10_9EURO|nr:hypothetical protein LTR84_011142 [Exophiala bonariae]
MEEPFLQELPGPQDLQGLGLDEFELLKTEAKVEIYHEMRGQDECAQLTEDNLLSQYLRNVNTIDLFHDLLILVSLVTVTSKSEIVDTGSLNAYICFFTLLWFTWLQSVVFDIRFSTETMLHFAHKAVSCAMMAMFVVYAVTYDMISVKSTADGPRALSLVLMVSRATLALQYSVAHWRASERNENRFPSLFTIVGLTVSTLAYLQVSLGMHSDYERFSIWYIWELDNLKTKRLFDRLGMLTIIILAKGVLALSRTTYRLFNELNWTATDHYGELMSAYFISVLYFKNVKSDNLDSLRQPLWMMLHYPLHVATLLILEGSSMSILMRTVSQISRAWGELHPLHDYPDWKTFFAGYLTEREIVSDVKEDMDTLFEMTFRNGTSLLNWYDHSLDAQNFRNIAYPFKSPRWQAEAAKKINELWVGVDRTIFARFGIDECAVLDCTSLEFGKEANQQHGREAAFRLLYIAAGSLLVILALMSTPTMGEKVHRQKIWLSTAIKMTVGISFLVPFGSNWIHSASGNGLSFSPWTLMIVTFGYFTVIACDRWINSSACQRRSTGGFPNPPEYVEYV